MASRKIDSELVKSLYQKDNLSMQQIADQLRVSSSGVRDCLDRIGISRRTISEAIFNLNVTKYGKKEFQLNTSMTPEDKELLIAGVMLYWGEGAKRGKTVNFVNSNPEMIGLFLAFLRKICGISEGRLKALLHIYPDHHEEELINYWVRVTKIPKSRFYRSFVHQGRLGTYKLKSKYGTLAISYSDKRLLNVILTWIDNYKQKLVK